jgi:origin recognition complex subunit 1
LGGQVAYQHGSIALSLENDQDSQRRPNATELMHVLDSLTAARALLIEDSRKGMADGDRKIMLNLEETEVLRVLGEAGQSWRSFLGI